jgi:hypothetical protein
MDGFGRKSSRSGAGGYPLLSPEHTGDLIMNWIRNRTSIEFPGIREHHNNPDFNPVEFDGFRIHACRGNSADSVCIIRYPGDVPAGKYLGITGINRNGVISAILNPWNSMGLKKPLQS